MSKITFPSPFHGRTGFNLNRSNQWYLLLAASSGLVSLLILLMLCPHVRPNAQAAETVTQTADSGATISVTFDTAALDLDVVPSPAGTLTSRSANLLVSTSNATGYTLYLSTVDTTPDLRDHARAEVIAPLPNATSADSFPANTWGYALSAADSTAAEYQAVPGSAAAILTTDAATTLDTYRFDLAAKVSTALPAGTYSNRLMISAIANPNTIKTLADLTYMQEMTPQACANTPEGTTKQLIDSRDNTKYYVAKLRDDNCWMTQNLALNISTNGLKATDTDIEKDWNQDSDYAPAPTQNYIYDPASDQDLENSTMSWGFGAWVSPYPAGEGSYRQSCSSDSSQGKTYRYLSTECDPHAIIPVNGWNNGGKEYKPKIEQHSYTIQLSDGTWRTITYDYKTIDEDNLLYDPHYLLGNYYQQNTAMAGTKNSENQGSICPKGWKLPAGGAYSDMTFLDDSYRKLFDAYGFTWGGYGSNALSKSIYGSELSAEDRTIYGLDEAQKRFNVYHPPLYFVSSGKVRIDPDQYFGIYTANSIGKFRSSNPVSALEIYFSDRVTPNGNSTNRSGYSVRCLAR